MFTADTHSDTLYALGVQHTKQPAVTPERLKKGGVTLQTFALWTGPKGNNGNCKEIVEAELSAVPSLIQAGMKQVHDPADAREGELDFMLSIEGGELFEESIESVAYWRGRGVRIAALLWNNQNRLGFPAVGGSRAGLTPYGIKIAREMQRAGMAVDVSHLNEAGFYDLFNKTDLPPMASHSCCRALRDHPRNLTDEQLKLMIREGGYVGMNFYNYFLGDDGRADLESVARHIDHICQLGGSGIVGLGSDFDGIECAPEGLQNPADLPNLFQALRKRGYDEAAVAAIAGGNLLNYFRRIS